MKLVIFDEYRLGILRDAGVIDVTNALPHHQPHSAASFWVELCRDFAQMRPKLEREATGKAAVPLERVKLRPPVLNPSKVLAAASNYGEHVQEMRPRLSQDWLLDFGVFLKAPSAIIGPGQSISFPSVGDREVHHEAELAFVIGDVCNNVSEADAMRYVLGYTCLIDVTIRGDGDRSFRKSFDGFCPVGPCLVTADEIGDPHNLGIKLWVNEDLRQDGNSRDMLVNIPQMIAYASRAMTLYPGDLFTTGTPDGVGTFAAGDTITIEVEKIGRMQISVV